MKRLFVAFHFYKTERLVGPHGLMPDGKNGFSIDCGDGDGWLRYAIHDVLKDKSDGKNTFLFTINRQKLNSAEYYF